MIVTLKKPLADGLRLVRHVEVRMPGPHVDLARPPRGMSRLAWHVSNVSDLPARLVPQLSPADAEAVVDAYGVVLTNFRSLAAAARTVRS